MNNDDSTEAPGIAGFPARLRRARLARGLTQEELATPLGLTRVAIARAEAGATTPRLEHLEAMARALGVTGGWLAFGEGKGP